MDEIELVLMFEFGCLFVLECLRVLKLFELVLFWLLSESM